MKRTKYARVKCTVLYVRFFFPTFCFEPTSRREREREKLREPYVSARRDVCTLLSIIAERRNDFVQRSIGSCPCFSTVLDIPPADTHDAVPHSRNALFLLLRLFAPFIYRFMLSSTAYGSARDFPGLL